MKKIKGISLISIIIAAALVAGCGGGGSDSTPNSGSGSTGADNSTDTDTGSGSNGSDDGENTDPDKSHLNSPWAISYDDEAGLKDTVIGVIYDGFFYGGNENRFAFGRVADSDHHIQFDLMIPEGHYPTSANKMSDSLYQGLFLVSSGSFTVVKYSSEGRTQETMTDTWQTNNGTSFTIDSAGKFNVVHDETGCTLDATVTMVEDAIYNIEGSASGCIDGRHQGKFRGMGTVPINVNVQGSYQKVFQPILIFSEGTTDVSYFPFNVKNF